MAFKLLVADRDPFSRAALVSVAQRIVKTPNYEISVWEFIDADGIARTVRENNTPIVVISDIQGEDHQELAKALVEAGFNVIHLGWLPHHRDRVLYYIDKNDPNAPQQYKEAIQALK